MGVCVCVGGVWGCVGGGVCVFVCVCVVSGEFVIISSLIENPKMTKYRATPKAQLTEDVPGF